MGIPAIKRRFLHYTWNVIKVQEGKNLQALDQDDILSYKWSLEEGSCNLINTWSFFLVDSNIRI